MKVCRGGVEEVHRRHRGLSWWTVPSNQLLPLLTSDPTDSAQLFQAFSSTLPPSPCTPPENPPYLTEPPHPPLAHLQTSVALKSTPRKIWGDSSCRFSWLCSGVSAEMSLTCGKRL